ncbi:hypothetical protein OFO99_37090, partial [Escherichia coli]|nr:hypothetical protein [Escherichia coli]
MLGRLNRLVGQQVPGFQPTTVFHSPSPRLVAAIAEAERDVAQRLRSTGAGGMVVSAPQDLVEDLQHRKQALKRAAESP